MIILEEPEYFTMNVQGKRAAKNFTARSPEPVDDRRKNIILIKLRVKDEKNFFGHISGGKMHENTSARITAKVWLEQPFEIHNAMLLHYRISPDEFDAIIEIDYAVHWHTNHQFSTNGSHRQAQSMLKRERSKILTAKLISRFKSRSTILLNQLHGTQGKVLWENGYEETVIDEIATGELERILETSVTEMETG